MTKAYSMATSGAALTLVALLAGCTVALPSEQPQRTDEQVGQTSSHGGYECRSGTPALDGVVTACVEDCSGDLRVIDPGTRRCERDEHQLSWNQLGPQGPAGPPGPPGPPGPGALSGLSGVHFVQATGPGDVGVAAAFALCPPGQVALGGGGQSQTISSFGGGPAYLIYSAPRITFESNTPIGWDAIVSAAPGFTGTIVAVAYAMCASVTP